MKYSKALLDEIYTVREDEKVTEASKVPLEWLSVFDNTKFNIINTEFKDHFMRFSQSEIDTLKDNSHDLFRLVRFSAGIQMMFVTDARIVKIRCENIEDFPMNNMSFVGRAGFDCYYKENEEDEFKFFYSTFAPVFEKDSKTRWEDYLYAFHQNKKRIILVNFPLYNGVKELSIGVEKGCHIEPYFYNEKKRILIYGTSILEGCSAPRPGLATTNQLSMKLKQEVLNYGFSGAAMCEIEVARILAGRQNIEMYILDVEANSGFEPALAERFGDLLETIYQAHPDVPVIVMNRIKLNQDDEKYSYIVRLKQFADKVFHDHVEEYQKRGKKIYFFDNYSLFDDCSDTIDGLHPTASGYEKLNKAYLDAILKVKSIS